MVRTRHSAGFLRLWLSLALLLSVVGPALPVPASTPRAAPCGPSFSGIELPALRTRTSRTYRVGGARHLVACAEAVNYRDANGAWQPIDNTLRASTVSGYAYQNAANAYQLLLPSSLSAAPVKVSSGPAGVAFRLVGASGTLATNANTATYANALPGVDVSYVARGD